MEWIFAFFFLVILTVLLRILPGKQITIPMIAIASGLIVAIFLFVTRNFVLSFVLSTVGGLLVAFVPSYKKL
jgi:hypothetical protein